MLRLEAEKPKICPKASLHFPKDFEMTYDFHDRGNFANPKQATEDLVKDADEEELTRLGRLFAYKSGSGSVWVGDGCS